MRTESSKTYGVTGMSCGHCEVAVAEEIRELPGVDNVSVDRKRGTATVHGEGFDDDLVRQAVVRAGYGVGES